MTGTIDPEGKDGGPMTSNKVIAKGYRWTTYAERLEKAGVSWKVYQQADNYGCNMLENFKQISRGEPRIATVSQGPGARTGGKVRTRRDERQAPGGFLDHHHQHAVGASRFHAGGRRGIRGQQDRGDRANPEVWAKTAFILNYDENDGIFDHVAPPTPPAGTPQEFVHGSPIGGGFRVPCIIVSPWTAGGWVCSQPFDHTSVLQLLEKFTGVAEPNISPWRRKTFGDLTAAFRFDRPQAKPPKLPETAEQLSRAKQEAAHLPKPILPTTHQTPPKQEKGGRKRVAPERG